MTECIIMQMDEDSLSSCKELIVECYCENKNIEEYYK